MSKPTLGETHTRESLDTDPHIPTVLDEAQRIIHGDRNKTYGNPLGNHECTAEMMMGYLKRKYGSDAGFDADDVCVFNIIQKLSRLAHTPRHRDSLIDICGYAGNLEMMEEESQRRADLHPVIGPPDKW